MNLSIQPPSFPLPRLGVATDVSGGSPGFTCRGRNWTRAGAARNAAAALGTSRRGTSDITGGRRNVCDDLPYLPAHICGPFCVKIGRRSMCEGFWDLIPVCASIGFRTLASGLGGTAIRASVSPATSPRQSSTIHCPGQRSWVARRRFLNALMPRQMPRIARAGVAKSSDHRAMPSSASCHQFISRTRGPRNKTVFASRRHPMDASGAVEPVSRYFLSDSTCRPALTASQ